ncbi:sodium coupled monocarboxylate transporter 1 [Echinococcus multilocularis]|uniref:Sodium coupled monocarboxylate transporter 1 n=1 Tax=Echinococcus multilocularis TaxID=6211 RepID=A0A068Y324_ECHMU|nr:sodium coupled monocarboxylate transporter 1 [Echinococcus multilocularis]
MLDRLDWPDYLLTAFLFAVYTFVGVFYGFKSFFVKLWRRTCCGKTKEIDSKGASEGADEIFLANRKLTLLPIVGSTLASFTSAVALMGNNSEFYLFGLEFLNLILGYIISFPIAAEVYAPVFYKLNLASGHEYLELRFCRVLRWIVTLVFCFQMIIYIAVVLYAPALALSRVTGLPVSASILTSGILGTLYTALGGIKAVVWTDVLQSVVMFGGLILLMVFGCQQVGGISRVWSIAKEGQRLDVFDFDPNPFVRHSIWTLAIGGAGMVMSIYASNQTQVQRYLACKDLKTARRTIHLQLPINAVLLSIQGIIGLIAYAVFVDCDPLLNGEISQYDQLFPHLVMRLFGGIPALRGLFLSTLFAAALSTLSSGVNGIACVLVEDVFMDIYLTYRKSSVLQPKTLILIARSIAVIFGLLIIGLAFFLQVVPAGVLHIAFSIFGAIGGPILAVFTLGMICPFVNKWGGLAGFVASLASGLTMIVGTLYLYTFKEAQAPPLSTAGCSTNVTMSPTTVAPVPQYAFSFFNLSYLYLTPFCLIICFVVATIVSLLTGMNSKTPVSHSLLAWQAVWLYSKLPFCVPSQSTPEAVTSLHAAKMEAMMHGNVYLDVFDEEGSQKVALGADNDVELVLEQKF